MAGLDTVGSVVGGATNLSFSLSNKETNITQFLINIDKLGVQVKNNFEVQFSGIPDFTFFIQSIDVPAIHQNFTEIHYNGRKIDIPINYDYDHEFSMTVINDAQGYIYSTIANFIMFDSANVLANSSYTMSIKACTGDIYNYGGSFIDCIGVRLENVSGISFGHDQNDIQTFTVSGKLLSFKYTPGKVSDMQKYLNVANKLLG